MIDRIRETASGLGDRVRDLRPARKDKAGRPPGLRSSIPPAPPKPGTPGTNETAGTAGATPQVDRELIGRRDRLIEKFTVMQADLGGAFYEMAIRDHVRLDALTAKAAELQVVDTELGQVERAIELERTGAVGHCSQCNAPYGPGVVYCSQCGHVLEQSVDPPAPNPNGPVKATVVSPAPRAAIDPARIQQQQAQAQAQASTEQVNGSGN